MRMFTVMFDKDLVSSCAIAMKNWLLYLFIANFAISGHGQLFPDHNFSDFLTRVKRGAPVSPFFRALADAFESVYGQPRQAASLGTMADLPQEILEGAASFTPKINNPLITKLRSRTSKKRTKSRNRLNSYNRKVQKQPRGYPYKEMLRKEDVPGCGIPLCTIVDTRIKSFKSMCHLVEWMQENGKYRTVLEIQKGSCENAIRFPRGRWRNAPWLFKRPSNCNKCKRDESCGQKVCINSRGHARSFDNICEANKVLQRLKSEKVISIGLGDCKALYSNCLYTEYFDMDDPGDRGDKEGVGQVFSYLVGLGDKHVHRSCKMNKIHYPIDIVTNEGQAEVEDLSYLKRAHEVSCYNDANNQTLKPPYFWDAKNVKCRDWKIRYCCENMWGTPSLYKVMRHEAMKSGTKIDLPKAASETDVFIDAPLKKELFEDCRWGRFMSTEADGSDINLIYTNDGKSSIKKRDHCDNDRSTAMYIDARTVDNKHTWEETGQILNKVSPFYGVYCERKNNEKDCLDYKFRVCCLKEEVYGPWSSFSECRGECGKDNAFQVRYKPCHKRRGNCIEVDKKWVVEDKEPCTLPCKTGITMLEWEQWSTCTATCGTGKRHRFRLCMEGNNGDQCEQEKEFEEAECQAVKCPEYKLTPWNSWTECSATCGYATRSRTRNCRDVSDGGKIVDNAKCSGKESAFTQQETCKDVKSCPRDGGFTEWGEWEPCDASCGKGNQTSQRFCLNPPPAFGGKPCEGKPIRKRPCEAEKPCPIPCVMSHWGQWSNCMQTCVDSDDVSLTQRIRYRHKVQEANHTGTPCPRSLIEIRECSLCNNAKSADNCVPRCPIDCQMSTWTLWSSIRTCHCPSSQSPGKKFRTRFIEAMPQFGGQKCINSEGQTMNGDTSFDEESLKCEKEDQELACPSKGRLLTPWTQWSACDAPCVKGGPSRGIKIRERKCTDMKKCGDKALQETRVCKSVCNHPDYSAWSMWSSCAVTCGTSQRYRSRKCIKGKCNETLKQSVSCDMGPCNGAENPDLIVDIHDRLEITGPRNNRLATRRKTEF